MEELEKSIEKFLADFDENSDTAPSYPNDQLFLSKDLNLISSPKEPCELNTDVDNKQETVSLPNTDNLLDIKAIKTSVLGKEQAKKRLQAFCHTKKLDFLRVKEELGRSKKPKKGVDPSEKQKTVIEEIEEIKKIENAYHEALEQQFLQNKNQEKRKRSFSRSRSRERHRKKSKREHRKRSRSRDDYSKSRSKNIEKLEYPNSWHELKEHNFQVETLPNLFPSEYNFNERKVYDFRKQLLFQAPSYPLQECVVNGVNGESIAYPAEYIRFTRTNPSISYCVNMMVSHDILNRNKVFEYVPRHYRNVLEQFVSSSSKRHRKSKSPISSTSRKWYPKESTACTLLETSLGLTYLQNYSDDDDQEREENYNEEEIDSDGVIANILEDLDKTELLLSKNNSKEVIVTNNEQPPSKKLKNKRTKKDKKPSKSKKEKSKHKKKHKVKKEKNQDKVEDDEKSEQENTAPNKNAVEKVSIKLESKKDRSRTKSTDSKISKHSISSDANESKKRKRRKSSSEKLSADLTIVKTELISDTELSTKKDDTSKSNKNKQTKEKRKTRWGKEKSTRESSIESDDVESKSSVKKHRKKSKKSKENKYSKKAEDSEDEDGLTSDDLRRIIKEKQKILEEHDRIEAEESTEVTLVAKNLEVNKIKSSMSDDGFGETPEISKLEKTPVSVIEGTKMNKKRIKETHNDDRSKSDHRKKHSSKHRSKSSSDDRDVTSTKHNRTEENSFCSSSVKEENHIVIDTNDQQDVTDSIYKLDELVNIDGNNRIMNENDNDVLSSKEKTISIEEVKQEVPPFCKQEKNTPEHEEMSINQMSKSVVENRDYCEDMLGTLPNDVESDRITEGNTPNITDTLYSPGTTPVRKTNMQISTEKLDIKKEDDMVTTELCPADKEIGTPNTEEYHSEWESESDVTENLAKHDIQNRSWESDDEILHDKYIRKLKPYKNREHSPSPDRSRLSKGRHTNFSLDFSLIQKDTRRRRSLEHSPEKFLEMPFNISNVRRDQHTWRNERPPLRNSYDRSPDRIEMDFRLRNDTSYPLVSEDSWEKNELISIKTEELRLEQERLSILHTRHQLEMEKYRLEELEKQRQQIRMPQVDERQRKFKDKNDRFHSHRDYDQFNLNNYIENKHVENSSGRQRRNRWDIPNKDTYIKTENTIPNRGESKNDVASSTRYNTTKNDHRKPREVEKTADVVSERKSKFVRSTVKLPNRSNKSPEKLENEYEKFLELLESEPDTRKNLGSGKKNQTKKQPKTKDNRTSKLLSQKRLKKHRRSSSSSSSTSSSLSSSSDSDSSTVSSSSTSSTSTPTSSSSSSYSRRKKVKKLAITKKKEELSVKPIISPSATMKTIGTQVIKTEIVKTVGVRHGTRDTAVGACISDKVANRNSGLLLSTKSEKPLPVPSPKVVINPSAIDSTPSCFSEYNSAGKRTEIEVVKIKTEKIEVPPNNETAKEVAKHPADTSGKHFNKGTSSYDQTGRESGKMVPTLKDRRTSPKRRRDGSSPRSIRNQAISPMRSKRRSWSPTHPDSYRRKDYISRRSNYSPKRRDVSPRCKDYSPRRYSPERSPSRERKQDSIQETLLRLAGMDSFCIRRKSPISSPVHGFKRSVADSTISDEQLLQYRVEENLDAPKFFNTSSRQQPPSPKQMNLDDHITQGMGIHAHHSQNITTPYTDNYQYTQENQQYYDQYNETNMRNSFRGDNYRHVRTVNQNLLKPIPLAEPNSLLQPPVQQNEVTNTTQQIRQVKNILQIIPIDSLQKPELPQSSIKSPVVQPILPIIKPTTTVSAVATVVTSTISSTTVASTLVNVSAITTKENSPINEPFSPLSPTEFSPNLISSPKDMNTEALIKEKIERRTEKDKRKLMREIKREEKEKKRIEERIKLNDSDSTSESSITDALILEKENISIADTDVIVGSTIDWPVPKIIFNNSHKTPEKGILLKSSRFSGSPGDINISVGSRKVVKFADGIFPGEGTSPSGGEELSSPPPAPKKLPKEKRSKKTKISKAAKALKRKKVKVKVVRRAEEEDEDDDLPPPPPPPGSPPPHLFPARIKTIINNIHPTVTVSIANPLLQADTSLAPPPPSPAYRPGLNVLTHQRPPQSQPGSLQHLGPFSSSSIVPSAGTGLPHAPLSGPPTVHHQQHHVGHNSNPFY